jgi:hypothetical protein
MADATIFGLETMLEIDEGMAEDDRLHLMQTKQTDVLELLRWDLTVEFAQDQTPVRFPLVFELGCIALVSALEVGLMDFAVLWVRENSEVRQREAIKRIKVPLGAYDAMSDYERSAYIVRELFRGLKEKSMKPGIDSFQQMFSILGLEVVPTESTPRNILELAARRNVYVHRGGVADQRFIDLCPWSELLAGSVIPHDWNLFRDFTLAVSDYADSVERAVNGEPADSN